MFSHLLIFPGGAAGLQRKIGICTQKQPEHDSLVLFEKAAPAPC